MYLGVRVIALSFWVGVGWHNIGSRLVVLD